MASKQLSTRERKRFWHGLSPLDRSQQARRQITIRISPYALDSFRDHGRGYQRRINEVLEFFVQEQSRRETSKRPTWRFRPPVRAAETSANKQQITLRVKQYVLDYFRGRQKKGRGYQVRINDVLEFFVEVQDAAGAAS